MKQVGISAEIRVAPVNEKEIQTDDPMAKVKKLAVMKSTAVPINDEREIIIAADTVVCYQNQIFEKPVDPREAYDMLYTLSGRKHEVYTGVCFRSTNNEKNFVEKTVVEFWPISKEEITRYVRTEEPYDKAGGYGIQSVGAIFVKRIIGDYYNVVGLPISRVIQELQSFPI